MSKKTNAKDLVVKGLVGGVVAGLMMGGTAMASVKGAQSESGSLFKIQELKGGFQLAKDEKAAESATPAAAGEKTCKDKSCKDKSCKDKSKGEKHCCEKSCHDKTCKDKSCKDKSCKDKSCKDKACNDKSKASTDPKVKEEMACGEKSCSAEHKKK
ncbi:MAG TPA: hypothetical protein VFX30_08985 [bacterium]|nr:hypothetical protein [bacterium]